MAPRGGVWRNDTVSANVPSGSITHKFLQVILSSSIYVHFFFFFFVFVFVFVFFFVFVFVFLFVSSSSFRSVFDDGV
jgi:hypothetical protein